MGNGEKLQLKKSFVMLLCIVGKELKVDITEGAGKRSFDDDRNVVAKRQMKRPLLRMASRRNLDREKMCIAHQ